MTVKANAPETFETLSTINWNRDATGAFEEEPTKGHGRIDCRRIQTMTPLPGTVNFPHIAQIFRIERDRESCKSRKKSTEIAYGITSVPKDRGTPEKLLAWNRGHWSIENNNHWVRDVNFKEDACLSRTMHGPSNGAICNNIALAIISANRHSTVTHYQRPNMTHPQEGGTGGEVSEILFFSAKSKRAPSLIYSMQIIPVCLSIVARRKGVSATRRGGLNWTPISLLVGHPCKLFHSGCKARFIEPVKRRMSPRHNSQPD